MKFIKEFLKNLLIVLIIFTIMTLLIAGPLISILLAIYVNGWFALLLIPALMFDISLIMTICSSAY